VRRPGAPQKKALCHRPRFFVVPAACETAPNVSAGSIHCIAISEIVPCSGSHSIRREVGFSEKTSCPTICHSDPDCRTRASHESIASSHPFHLRSFCLKVTTRQRYILQQLLHISSESSQAKEQENSPNRLLVHLLVSLSLCTSVHAHHLQSGPPVCVQPSVESIFDDEGVCLRVAHLWTCFDCGFLVRWLS
jgi:hypothetical protein